MLARKALAGTAGAPKEYVEDVFSTYLYTGNGSTQTITNNIDLSGEGGLVWIKARGLGYTHFLNDTARGAGNTLQTNKTAANTATTSTFGLTSFASDGFVVKDDGTGPGGDLSGQGGGINGNTNTYVSWTFRKAKKFFDVVTYTGNGADRTISHNLGSVPGCIMVKRTDSTGNWFVYHRSLTTPASAFVYLNLTNAEVTSSDIWNNTAPTSTEFSLDSAAGINTNGATFVAYLFAHDAGGFGDAGSDSIIKCGSYTGNGATGQLIDLGWEPQWVMIKQTDAADQWVIIDNMRGWASGSDTALCANTSDAEAATVSISGATQLDPKGFRLLNSNGALNQSSGTFIYIAIRRGPMKTPTSGTSVFKPNTYTGTGADQTITGVGFAPDLIINKDRNAANTNLLWDHMRGPSKYLVTSNTAAEATWDIGFDSMDGFRLIGGGTGVNASGGSYVHWFLKRAPGFFDVVCYAGNGNSSRTVSHNLSAVPELIIVKNRTTASRNWYVYSATLGYGNSVILNDTLGSFATTNVFVATPTSTVFTVGDNSQSNESGSNFVAYLFASLSGVSKVGSYTGNGSSVTVTTDFQPRFILVKRTDSTGNWIVGDSARGLVAGSDPYLLLNSTAAEDTDEDWVDITSTSFTVNQTTAANANVNTGTYIYLAIA